MLYRGRITDPDCLIDMKNAIITGATGVIGMALMKKCIENNVNTILLVNPDSKRLDRIPASPNLQIVKCSITDYLKLEDELCIDTSGDTVFYHLAWAGTFGPARNDISMQNHNVTYALDAVRLAKRLGCKAFVGVGSQAEYGRVEGLLSEKTKTNPENGYGIAKLEAGKQTRLLCEQLGMRHIWTRVLSIYGPYDGENTMVIATIKKLLEGQEPELTKGEQLWDYLYASDAATALYLLGDRGLSGSVYPIGSGLARPLKEYIEAIRDAINPSLPLGFGKVPYGDKQVMHLQADIGNIVRDTGFSPRVSFDEGIRETIEYVRSSR